MAVSSVKEKAKRLFEAQEIEIKTKSVEKMLSPLIKQVTTLQENISGRTRNKKLRNVFKLIQIVDKATDNFTTAAENIAADNPEFQDELWLAIEEVRTCGNFLHESAQEYATDCLSSRKRETMEEKAGDVLRAVTRLLVLIDLIDIHELFKASSRIEAKLQNLKQVQTWETFVESMKAVAKDIRDVSETAIARQKELKNSTAKQLLVEAHAELSQQSKMLITSTKTYLNHPSDASAIANRDYTVDRLSEVLKTIARLADGEKPEDIQKDLDNSENESVPPATQESMPSSPVHPPSSHVYPIEFYSSLPSVLPQTPPVSHGSVGPPTHSSQALSSEDDDSTYNRRKHHHNPRISGEFDHLNSQDTYSSTSSFSPYRQEDDESAVDISKGAANNLPVMSSSKVYQVSSGTLPVMQVSSTKVPNTETSHAHPSQSTTSASLQKQGASESLQGHKGGGSSFLHSYPRGHAHQSKVTVSSTAVSSSRNHGNASLSVTQNPSSAHQQSYPRGHEHSAVTSLTLASAGHQPMKHSSGVTVSSHKPHGSSSYPRGHSHFKNLPPSSPARTRAGGFGASVHVTPPPKGIERSIEKFETALQQTVTVTEPPAVEATQQLQTGIDNILSAASIIADFESTRDQHGLLAQCDVVREKLQNLLHVIVTDDNKHDKHDKSITSQETEEDSSSDDDDNGSRGKGDGVEEKEVVLRRSNMSNASVSSRSIRRSVQLVSEETATLRAELRKAMIDHVSDTFVDPCIPLTRMVAAAKQGNKPNVEMCAEQFLNHAEKLVHVANLVCSLTNEGPANREVKMAAKPIETLKHQVVSAAKTLVGHPDSEAALKNMSAFQDLWIEKVNALTDAVDKVIPLQDFIAVTEAHIREDSRRLIEAIEVRNFAMSTGCANVIQGRFDRLVQVVKQDMVDHAARYAPENATGLENVMEKMVTKVFPEFQAVVQMLCKKQARVYDSDIRNLEDHLQNINDGVRDMRIYVLRTRTKEELKAEPDVDDFLSATSSGSLSTASFEFMDEDIFSGGQPVNIPSPEFNRANKHGQANASPKIEVDIEEVEVTGQQYASMLSYPSMNILEGIQEEDEEDSTDDSESSKGSGTSQREREERERIAKNKEMEKERERLEKERQEKEREEERIKAEQKKEEEIRRKNEELLNKNFKNRRQQMQKASSLKRLQEDRPGMTDEDYMTITGTTRRRLIKRTPSVAAINETETAKAVLAQLSVKEQQEIAKEQEKLEEEHKVFEEEVNQWDDTSNDIIVLAKEMCWMVMDMSDFLSGEGQLQTTMDVINTAKDVTIAAKNLISLAQQVADLCPKGSDRNDLLAYLDRIKLFCNQLKISSGVLSDLENVRGTADNLNNLLISAKSLMNTVVMVVKGCYVASKADLNTDTNSDMNSSIHRLT